MFWFRKKKTPPPNVPREHHYVFAHQMLRQACEQDPLKFFGVMSDDEREGLLALLWKLTADVVGRPVSGLETSDVSVRPCLVNNKPTVLLKMPTPVATTEAHFVGVVYLEDMSQDGPPGEHAFRYFTLEHGSNQDGSTRTVLCEWVNGAHINLGDGPPATFAAFKAALCDWVAT